MGVTEIKSYTQHDYKAGNTCQNMPETAAYSSATTEDQHVQGTSMYRGPAGSQADLSSKMV